jgi:hypothetical protein
MNYFQLTLRAGLFVRSIFLKVEQLTYDSATSRYLRHGVQTRRVPFCEAVIPTGTVLLEYEVNGETRVFAECYECDEPVQPQ